MKKLALLLISAVTVAALHAQAPQVNDDISKVIQFKETDHDFGKIPYGKPAKFDLVMKNISNDTVSIQDVRVGCGCTTPEFPEGKGPFKAGQEFKVTIGFNGYTEGNFNKVVTIYFDGGLSQLIKFHGETVKQPDNAAPGNSSVQQLKSGGQ